MSETSDRRTLSDEESDRVGLCGLDIFLPRTYSPGAPWERKGRVKSHGEEGDRVTTSTWLPLCLVPLLVEGSCVLASTVWMRKGGSYQAMSILPSSWGITGHGTWPTTPSLLASGSKKEVPESWEQVSWF